MSQRIVTADWAAQVPFQGITDLPEWLKPGGVITINLSDIAQSGAMTGQVATWNGTAWVPKTPASSGGSGDGGTTIKAGDEPAVAVRKRPNGEPASQYEETWFRWEYNVRLYGAAGDGVTDDSSAVLRALTDLEEKGGGSLYFPAGNYVGMQDIGYISVPCSIRGDGIGQSVLNFGTTGGISFYAGTSSMAFEVRDIGINAATTGIAAEGGTLYLDGVAINAFDTGMLMTDCSGGYVEHAIISGPMQEGISLRGQSEDNTLSDIFISGPTGAAISCGTGTVGNRIDNIAFVNVGGALAVDDQGTNNYVNELYGIGGNTDARWDNRKELVAYHTWQPCEMPPGAGAAEDVWVPGASAGDQVIMGPPYSMDWCLFSGYVRSPNTVRVLLFNLGPGPLALSSGAWKIRVIN